MISNKLILILLLTLSLSPLSLTSQEIDPVSVSPDMYKVLLENEYVRVVRYTINPGQSDKVHTHPAKVSYTLAPGTLRITVGDSSFTVAEHAGEAVYRDAAPRHFATNTGNTPVTIVLFEPKKIDATRAPAAADPFRNNPSTLQVLLENDSVRVMKATLPPGHKEKEHTHPPYAMYILSSGTARFHYPDGSTRDVELTAGDARFSPAVTHWAENTGSTALEIILVELRHK